MIQYLNTFTEEPQDKLFLVTSDPVEVGTPVQVAVDKKGKPVLKPVKTIVEKRDARGFTKITPQYYEVVI